MYRRLSFLALAYILVVVLVSLVLPFFREVEINLSASFLFPSPSHLFGTDRLGRDLFVMSMEGVRNSFIIGISATLISLTVGTFIGILAGTMGGIVDALLMRVLEVFQAFPGFLMAVALAAFMGPSVGNVIFAISAFAWVGFARITRSIALRAVQEDYVSAVVTEGASPWRVLFFHILPQVKSGVSAQALITLAGAMLTESSLSFLGVGPGDMESIGRILSEASEFILLQPYAVILPGGLFFSVIFAVYILHDALTHT